MVEGLQSGRVYKISNKRFGGAIELEVGVTNDTTLNDFTGLASQHWRVTITNGLCSFFNVASERYLGLKQSRSTAALSDGVQLVGTADEFLWEVTRTGTVYRLSVPYTNYVLDADTYGTLPGIKLQLYQRWTD
ncbi:hypothetical protein CC1G_10008 [Coprinopsis cinerea okayama7|uniref:Ricin B lectin domain-containing protein n=1 Tax=Coprinopsis cinerea (strain Okayama-7 / 130 / ATCC MYA-4618 / FGSC 9003) TaxID=240176 RepID=A8NDK3_COPC7|nr:hypothetical protein CC1G_10008 [Coprinopsis cinerea okayama7\|eukprot:XP_001832794.1 hypothetical protein CC1G_10008 [Coprinopsis cinerea okayama7\